MLIIGPGKTLLYAGTITLETIVVTAPHEEGAEKRIKSKTLKTHKVVDLAEILSDEMVEATMIRKGAYGNEVSIRGFGQSNLRVLIDNGILEGACGSRKDPSLSHINMLTVDKIEVRQGPFDVTKAGALGGSINVVTKKPQKGFHGEVLGKGGSYDFWSGGSYVTGGNDKVQALIGYNYSESGQYEDGDGNRLSSFAPGGRPYNAKGRHMKAFEKDDVWGKLQFTPADNQTILISHIYGYAEDILTPRVGMDMESEKTNLTSADYIITELGRFSQKLTLSFYRNKIEHSPFDQYRVLKSPNLPAFHRRNDVESIITGGQIENEQTTDFATFTYGFDLYKRNWKGKMYNDETGVCINDDFIPDIDAYNYGAYIQTEKNIDKWALGAGIRADRFETEAEKKLKFSSAVSSTNKNTDRLVSGYLSAKYRLTENVHLFAGVGRTIRTPTGVERYIQGGETFFGNPDLDPTKNTESDIGFEITSHRFSFRANAFYSDLKNYIYQQMSMAGNKTWTNIDAHLYGGNVKAVVDIISDFSIEAGMAYQRGVKDTEPDNNSDKDLAEIPPLKTRLALHYDTREIFGILEWIHSEDADKVDSDAGEQKLDGWDVVNLRAGYQPNKYLTFNVGVNNIFDRHYAVANSYEWDVVTGAASKPAIVYEPGRFFYATVIFAF
jgi:iron complex outermembrane receptor protein